MPFKDFVCLVLLLCASEVHPQNVEGKPCRHAAKNLQGTCTLLKNCKSALDDVQNQVLPQICGLAATAPYVCCPTEEVGAKSRAKCLEYSKLRTGKCNIEYFQASVSLSAVGREFPHMAILGYSTPHARGRAYRCGGILISERFVMVPANCVTLKSLQGHDLSLTYVRLGDLDLLEYVDDAEPQEYKVDAVYVHPDFVPPVKDYDIALVRLRRDVEFTPHVRPACLYRSDGGLSVQRLTKVAWDPYKVSLKSGVSCRPKKVLVSNEDCNKTTSLMSAERMICANPSKPECSFQGELGGSLLLRSAEVDCMYDLVGMFIHVRNCSETNGQEVYTRVSYYIDWIESIVWP